MSRILLIGLDGATLDLVEPWARQAHLPVMARMMENGAYGRLRSVLPVLSSAAWASFMTGMNPGKHGFYDFVRREPDGYRLRLLHRNHLRGATLWQLLNRHGLRTGVVNVPMTYPPEVVDGFLVSGLGTPDYKPFTYPAELGPELLARGYRVNKRVAYKPGDEDRFLAEAYDLAERQTESALWLMEREPWDFFMLVYRDTDEMHHFFWKHMDPSHPAHDPETDPPYRDAILDFYKKMDADIGRLMEKAGPDTITLVISDHGGGPLYRDVFLNEWLRREGYLATRSDTPELQGPRALIARAGITRENISKTLRGLGLGRVERAIKDLLGERIAVLPRSARAEFPDAIDWPNTRAYSFGYHGQIYLNVAGREPQGVVWPGAEYEALCDEIMERLKSLTDPLDGRPVVDRVVRGDTVYHGPALEFAPDLIIVMRDFSYITRQGYEFGRGGGQIFASPLTHESGSHRMDGLLLMSGPQVPPQGSRPEGADLIDIAPTVLHLLDCPVPRGMDGRVLEEWLAARGPVRFDNSSDPEAAPAGSELSAEEEAEMVERLKNLGYLE